MATTHQIGARVSFLPGPRSTARVTGTVAALGVGANGQFMSVTVAGRDTPYKVRPGSATAA